MTVSLEKDRLTARSPEGAVMGHIRFPGIRTGLVNIASVVTEPEFRDTDTAEAMMEALLCHLDRTGQKAALTAPFAQRYVAEHPRWKRILPEQLHFTTY